ncbi:MAG: molybdopterin-dependent oxidoreductase [Desulfuromonadia bacterium]
MVSLTIDGKNITAPEGATILEAARSAGIEIPTLCWLEKVSPTGACRLCAVEIEGVDRTMTACNTVVKEGIVVTTQSPRLSEIRTKIMELMLVNHPLDCPVCDAGGECDLQDTCYSLSVTRQEYSARLERKPIRYDWKLLESDPNRCILCEKCVKVDHEIVGCDAIRVVDKGDDAIIDTADGTPLDCDFCGNCIEACPTGTLISKPFKFLGRPWTFTATEGVCPFCSVGCQILWHTRDNRIGRVTSPDSTFNRGNLCINGRFGYTTYSSPERLTTPLVRRDGKLLPTDWESAIDTVVERFGTIVSRHGADAVAGIGSPRMTNEEQYLFQKYLREVIKTPHIDSEAGFGLSRGIDIIRGITGVTASTGTLDRIERSSVILVLGSDLKGEATGYEYRVIKGATKHDTKLITLTNRTTRLRKYTNVPLLYRAGNEASALAAIVAGLREKSGSDPLSTRSSIPLSAADYARQAGVDPTLLDEAVTLLAQGGSLSIIYGADCFRAPDAEAVMGLTGAITLMTGAGSGDSGGIFPVDERNNSLGMLDMGVSPTHLPGWVPSPRPGRGIMEIIDGIERREIKGLIVAGSDPLTTFPRSDRIRAAFEQLEFLVVLSILPGPTTQAAHLVLPAAAPPEKSGSFTTMDGRLQTFEAAISPPGDALSDREILSRIISRSTRLPEAGIGSVRREIEEKSAGMYRFSDGARRTPPPMEPAQTLSIPPFGERRDPITLLIASSRYHNGTMTTFSENNLTVHASGSFILSPEDARELGVREGGEIVVESAAGSLAGHAVISGDIPKGLLVAPSNFRDFRVMKLLGAAANQTPVTVRLR